MIWERNIRPSERCWDLELDMSLVDRFDPKAIVREQSRAFFLSSDYREIWTLSRENRLDVDRRERWSKFWELRRAPHVGVVQALWRGFASSWTAGMSGALFLSMLAAPRRRDSAFVVSRTLRGRRNRVLLLLGSFHSCLLFVLKPFFFSPASLPAVLPVTDQELETEPINLHARLEADT